MLFLSLRDPRRPPRASGIEGFQLSKLRRRSLQKTQSEHEHASENEQEHNMERMRNEGRQIIKHKQQMLPEGARRAPNQGLEASGALLGAMWAQSGCQEHSKWLLGAARGGKTNCWLGPGPPQRRKVDRFQGPRGALGRAPGRYFWSFFGHAPWELQKS